ncbi:MAG: hypothetical protein IJW60_02500 [Clostridia bacterium]|nr:hypothetical protein [Clostridia bacterium]
MEFFNLYNGMKVMFSMASVYVPNVFYYSLALAAVVWLGLFVLQGFGLYTMAKNRQMKGKWKAFVPFLNIHYMGALAGECHIFGQRVKRAGLYAMLAQIVVTVVFALIAASEIYLYTTCGAPKYDEWNVPYWTNLQGFALTVSKFYDVSAYLLSIFQLVYELLMLVLALGLYKKYAPNNYMPLGFLELFVPLSRFIVIFVLRNRKAIDYEAYMRARHEAYMRRRQQYQNGYGNPYGNPYANPYNTPYGQGYGEPQRQAPPEDPFAEFGGAQQGTTSQTGGQANGQTPAGEDSNSDDFFA